MITSIWEDLLRKSLLYFDNNDSQLRYLIEQR